MSYLGTLSGDLKEWKAYETQEMLEQMQEMRLLRMEDLVNEIGKIGNKQTKLQSTIEVERGELLPDLETQEKLLADPENEQPWWRDPGRRTEMLYRKQHLEKLLEQDEQGSLRQQEPQQEREEEKAKREERQLRLKERRRELQSELQQESNLVLGRGRELTREVQRKRTLEQQMSSVEKQLKSWERELGEREQDREQNWEYRLGPEVQTQRMHEPWTELWMLDLDLERGQNSMTLQQQQRDRDRQMWDQQMWERRKWRRRRRLALPQRLLLQVQLLESSMWSCLQWCRRRCRRCWLWCMGYRKCENPQQEWEEEQAREWVQVQLPTLARELVLKLVRGRARKVELQLQLKQLSSDMKDHHLKWMHEQQQRTQKSNAEWTQNWPQEPILPQAMVVSGLDDWLKLSPSFRPRRMDLTNRQLELGQVEAELQHLNSDKEWLGRWKEDDTRALQDASNFRRPLDGLDYLAQIWLLAYTASDYLPLNEPSVEERAASLRRRLSDGATLLDVILGNQTTFAGQSPYLDALLVFAGLFSAVLAAFLIEVRKGLQEDLLLQILHQLEQSSQQPFQPTPVSVWTNGLWFASLGASLMGAVVVILAKSLGRWTISGKDAKAIFSKPEHLERRLKEIRRLHMHANFEGKFTSLVAASSILIYVALILFFSGLSLLLYTTQRRIGIGFLVITSLMSLYTFGVTLHNFYLSLGSR